MSGVPASSHGTTFNGGTITSPLVVDTRPDNATVPLRVRAGDPSTVGIDLRVDPSAPRIYYQGLDSFAQLRLYDDFSAFQVDLSNAGLSVAGGNIGRSDPTTGANGVSLRSSGVWFAVHAAPADADLDAGDCVLWFDQSNGAAATRLMVKGKSADGTVKTAAIVLA